MMKRRNQFVPSFVEIFLIFDKFNASKEINKCMWFCLEFSNPSKRRDEEVFFGLRNIF